MLTSGDVDRTTASDDIEIAGRLGHSPTMTLNTYGHVMDELDSEAGVSAEEEIRPARAQIRPISCPRAANGPSALAPLQHKTPPERGLSEWAIQDSNLGPLPYQASQGVPPSTPEGQMSLFDEVQADRRGLTKPHGTT